MSLMRLPLAYFLAALFKPSVFAIRMIYFLSIYVIRNVIHWALTRCVCKHTHDDGYWINAAERGAYTIHTTLHEYVKQRTLNRGERVYLYPLPLARIFSLFSSSHRIALHRTLAHWLVSCAIVFAPASLSFTCPCLSLFANTNTRN